MLCARAGVCLLLGLLMTAIPLHAEPKAEATPEPDLTVSFPRDQEVSFPVKFASTMRIEMNVERVWHELVARVKLVVPVGYGIQIASIEYTSQTGDFTSTPAPERKAGRATSIGVSDLNVDFSKPITLVTKVVQDSVPPATPFRMTCTLISISGMSLEVASVGPGVRFWGLEGWPRVVDIAESLLGEQPPSKNTPDVIVHFALPPEPGNIECIPYPRLSFVSPPTSVLAFDCYGTDLIREGKINFGEPTLLPRGDFTLPITEVSPELGEFAIMIRGIIIHIEEGVSSNCRIGYQIKLPPGVQDDVRTCTVVEDGELLEPWEASFLSYRIEMAHRKLADDGIFSSNVRAWRVGEEGGYFEAVTMTGPWATPDWLKAGDLWLRPTAGFRFVADENTRLYAYSVKLSEDSSAPAEYTDLTAEVTAAMTVSEHGDLVIRVDSVPATFEGELYLMIAAPRIELVPDDQRNPFGEILVGGTISRGGMTSPFSMLTREPVEDESLYPKLPTEPKKVKGLVPVARFEMTDED